MDVVKKEAVMIVVRLGELRARMKPSIRDRWARFAVVVRMKGKLVEGTDTPERTLYRFGSCFNSRGN
jgi:hypothetical protein